MAGVGCFLTPRPSPAVLDKAWGMFSSPLLLILHSMVSLVLLTIITKRETLAALTVAVIALNAAAALLCLASGAAPHRLTLLRKLAALCGTAAWACRTLGFSQWAAGQPVMQPDIVRCYNDSACSGYIAELVYSLGEQVAALMLLPDVVVLPWLLVHVRFLYIANSLAKAPPSLLFTAAWWLAQYLLPRCLFSYMTKAAAAAQSRASQLREGGVCVRTFPASATQVTACDEAGTSQGSEKLRQKQQAAEEDLAAITAGRAQQAAQQPASLADNDTPRPLPDSEAGPQAAAASSCALPDEPVNTPAAESSVLDTRSTITGSSSGSQVPTHVAYMKAADHLRALQLLKQQAHGRQYTSRLKHYQVAIKLMNTEPKDLGQDILSRADEVFHGIGGVRVQRACVRIGCCLLVLDLAGVAPADGQPPATELAHIFSEPSVKNLLGSLLAPGTAIPDGAAAHISVGDQRLTATWRQEHSSWVVTRVSQNKNIPNSTPQLSILHVDCPITRLTMQSSHRVSLLLQQHLPAPAAVVFEGSDQTSAPPEQPAGSDALVVSCIARGSWGTCLPVTVAALEEEAMTPEEDTHVTDSLALLTALSVDVDLSQAPHGGLVQLELWCGRSLLASAPLLLLPPLAPAGGNTSDALLEELQEYVEASSWDASSGKGVSSFLTDLGQLMFSTECITTYKPTPVNTAPKGPATWGGVTAATAWQHACNPAMLADMLVLAEGLADHARDEGLTQTLTLVGASTHTISQRITQLHGKPGTSTAGVSEAPQCATPAGSGTPLKAAPGCSPVPAASANPDASRAGSSNGVTKKQHTDDAGLRKRVVSKADSSLQQQHQQECMREGGSAQAVAARPDARSVLRRCMIAFLVGFKSPGVEQHYKRWVAEKYSSVVYIHSLVFSLWIAACFLRSVREVPSLSDLVAEIPIFVITVLPFIGSILAETYKASSLQEPLLVGHALGRLIVTAAGATGALPWPKGYQVTCRIQLPIWGEPCFHSVAEPMRLPALLVANVLLAGFNYSFLIICGRLHGSLVWSVVVPRVCAATVGAMTDVARRYMFLHQRSA